MQMKKKLGKSQVEDLTVALTGMGLWHLYFWGQCMDSVFIVWDSYWQIIQWKMPNFYLLNGREEKRLSSETYLWSKVLFVFILLYTGFLQDLLLLSPINLWNRQWLIAPNWDKRLGSDYSYHCGVFTSLLLFSWQYEVRIPVSPEFSSSCSLGLVSPLHCWGCLASCCGAWCNPSEMPVMGLEPRRGGDRMEGSL